MKIKNKIKSANSIFGAKWGKKFFLLAFFVFVMVIIFSRFNISHAKETDFQFDKFQNKAGEKAIFSIEKSTGKLDFISADGGSLPLDLSGLAKKDPAKIANQFMKEYGGFFGLENTEKELGAGKTQKDNLGMTHVRFQQNYDGVPVFGGEGIVHLKKDLAVKSASGRFIPNISIDTEPKISKAEAGQRAKDEWKKQFGSDSAEIRKTNLYVFNKGLIENKKNGKNYLVWQVELFQQKPPLHEYYFIDAQTGKIIYQITGMQSAVHRHIWDCSYGNGDCYMDATDPLPPNYTYGRSEGQSARGQQPILHLFDTDNLYDIAGSVHNYYTASFSRNGANNSGGIGDGSVTYPSASTTGLTFIDYHYFDANDYLSCPNAFFNGENSIHFCKNYVTEDITGHEYAHAVNYFSILDGYGNPAGLTYSGESGALNENNSDVFGEALEYYIDASNDWLLGEDLPDGASRSMSNPGSMGSYPNKFYDSNYYCGSDGGGGVHTNSSVPNHAAYLMAVGGTYNGCSISAIGRAKEEAIFYQAQTSYYTTSTNFNGAYNALISSCNDLYGAGSADCANATKALQSVEMDQGGQCSGVARLEPLCDTVAPVISGVANGAEYNHSVSPAFDHGTATLNGVSFSSGTTISTSGSYTLTATDRPGNSTTVSFSLDVDAPVISGVANGAEYNHSVSPAFDHGTATLNGASFSSGTAVSTSGSYTLTATDRPGNSATVSFSLDVDPPSVSGVSDGVVYNADVVPTFDDGTATLDGASFSSGTTVSANGEHTLIVTDRLGNSTTVRFTIKKFDSSVPTLNYSASKKVKKTITIAFYNQNISPKKKNVKARLGGRKVTVTRVSRSGSDLRITINFKYGRWPAGTYDLVATYNYKVKKTRFSGSLTADDALTII